MMSKIRICYIVGTLNQGGAERQIVELIKNIDKDKFEVTFCSYLTNKLFYQELLMIEGINHIFYNNTYNNKISRIFSSGFFIYKTLKKGNFDIVHTMLYFNGMMVRLFAPWRYNNKIIHSIRNNFEFYIKGRKFEEKILLRKSYIVTNTESAANAFKSIVSPIFRNKIIHIYNGYDVERFVSRKKESASNVNKKIIIGMIGRMANQKNQIQAIRTIARLPQNVELHIYGAMDDASLEMNDFVDAESLKDKIQLLDPINNIETIYPKFDIFLLTSLFEGCPNVLFEAMLSGCFSIISEASNTDKFVDHNINGLIYDGSDEDLIKKLNYAISILGKESYREMCENGYRFARENFSLKKMINSYQDLYLRIYNLNK